MTRQYIGARYVPLMCGDYDSTMSYEALSIVTYGNNSYTSKKPVPVGVNPSNEEYWVLTSNYSGQIAEIISQIASINKTVGEHTEDISSLDSRVTTLEGGVETLNTNVTNIQGDITDIQGDVTTLESKTTTIEDNVSDLTDRVNRKFILIGDSYGVGITAGGTTTGWCDRVKEFMNLTSDNCIISAVGGSGFIGNVESTFSVLLSQALANVSDLNSITDVVVIGGYNDAGKGVDSAINTFCGTVKNTLPNAKLWLGMAGYSSAYNTALRPLLYNLKYSYSMAVTGKTCFINGLDNILRSSTAYMSSDTIHPTSLGYMALGKAITSALCGGSVYPCANSWNKMTLTGANGVTPNIDIYERVVGEDVQVRFPVSFQSFELGSTKPKPNSFFKLCSISNSICKGISTGEGTAECGFTVTGLLRYRSGSAYKNMHGILCINNGGLYLNIQTVENGTYIDLTDCDMICIDGGVYKIPCNLT